MWPSYQQICFFLYGLLVFCICVCPLLSETHWALVSKDDSSDPRVVSNPGSPFCLKQPHSLIDLIEQNKIINEMKKLQQRLAKHGENAFYANRKETQETKNFRFLNPDCEDTKNMKFAEETFSDFWDFDLMPHFTEPEVYLTPPLARDIVKIKKLRQLYFEDLQVKPNGEPVCHKIFVSEGEDTVLKIADIITEDSQPEKNLLNLSEKELLNLGELLAAGLESDNFKDKYFALYYSAFYWRYLGNHREAATCLQKHLIMGVSTAGFYQIGCIHSRIRDFYHAIAAFRTTNETLAEPPTAQWFAAGGDVHVLTQLYRAARSYYKKALKLATGNEHSRIMQKFKLMNCEIGVEDLIVDEQTLVTFNDLKASMHNWEAKQSSMFERMLPVDEWTRAKYVYEILTDGPIAGISCRKKLNVKQRQVLVCDVDSPRQYNESISFKRIEKRKKAAENIDELVTEINKAQRQQANFLNYILEAHIATQKYIKELEPYLNVEINEPQSEKVYPKKLEKSKVIPETNLIFRDKECKGLESFDVDELYDLKKASDLVSSFPSFSEMFIPPDNKGYFASYFLTTLVALSPSQISPLPWAEPHCSSKSSAALPENFEIYPGLTLNDFSSNFTKGLRYSERSLKSYFSTILGKGPQAVLGDVGQRISTLLRYGIGPKWISANLAALYWRHVGNIKEAAVCLNLALKDKQFEDLALVQLAQLTLRLGKDYIPISKKIIKRAVEIDGDEPVSHFILGFSHYISGSFYSAKMEFLRTLELEPGFDEAKTALRSLTCLKKSRGFWTVKTKNQPMCCWPGEQNVFCFEEDLKRGDKHCFKIQIKDEAKKKIEFQYVRCNGKYQKQSFKSWTIYELLSPYFISKNDIEDMILQKRILNISATSEEDKNLPVFALDYGGFGEERFKVYEQEKVNLEEYEQSMTDFGSVREERLRKERESLELQKAKLTDSEFEKKINALRAFTERKQIMALDVGLPSYLPEPSEDLIKKGLIYLKPPKENTLADYCTMTEKNKRVLDHPSPTYISVTAKGVKLEEFVDLTAPVTTITKDEPICPEVELNQEWKQLDDLPAFRFREHFNFYKPETAMTDTLMSLGHKYERVEHVSARLHLAMKTSKLNPKHSHLQDDGVNGVITAVSTLYWRVKGDAVNALKCLRHALKNLPRNMKDTALISMANIYHQAGFLHSALIVGGKAHQMTPNLVSIHFTLANIYATMGDHTRALKFYYSTLALQPNFQPAKERIRAIYCLTHGKVKI